MRLNEKKSQDASNRHFKWCEAKYFAGTSLSKIKADHLLMTRKSVAYVRDFVMAVNRLAWVFSETHSIPESIRAVDAKGLREHFRQHCDLSCYAVEVDLSGEACYFDKYNITLFAILANIIADDDLIKTDLGEILAKIADRDDPTCEGSPTELKHLSLHVEIWCYVQPIESGESEKTYIGFVCEDVRRFLAEDRVNVICADKFRAFIFASLVKAFETASLLDKPRFSENVIKLRYNKYDFKVIKTRI